MPKIYKIMFIVSLALVVISLVAFAVYGLRLGVDFTGGSLVDLTFKGDRPDVGNIRKTIEIMPGITDLSASLAGDKGVILKMGKIDNNAANQIVSGLSQKFGEVTLNRLDTIEPSIGSELKVKSFEALLILFIAIVIYISFVFRKMSAVISPWVMGMASIIALFHDVIIPVGIFSLLTHFLGIEIGAIFVAAALTIVGFSVSDTVIVFDRTRENVLRFGSREEFGAVVHKSILQTLTRSINTIITVLLSLFAIYFFGGETTRYFSLALILGIGLGAYSSIFVASPILVWFGRRRK
ncbi:MAG: preprotein translocase subunit SecF [Parcubacteria group bacterium Licking1014_17]|nr:MAG: preprotein translocase subunit SecF [Parcubacteria group bacterium Licking1014_17]